MINTFIKYLQYEKRYSPHTLIAYKADLEGFQSHLNIHFSVAIETAEYHHIRSWIVFLVEEKLQAESINRKIISLRSFYKFLLKRDLLVSDPTIKLKLLKSKKTIPVFVPQSDILSLLDQYTFSDDFFGWRDKLILELLYGTGIRLNELIQLKESDINYYEGLIKVLGKRNKERFIPIPKSLGQKIEKYCSKKLEHFNGNSYNILIVTDTQDQSYPMLIYRTVRKYLDLFTTVDKRSPHVLRHTFATHLLDKGADLNAVKDLLGHTSLAATQVYTHNSLDKLKKVFDQAHPKA